MLPLLGIGTCGTRDQALVEGLKDVLHIGSLPCLPFILETTEPNVQARVSEKTMALSYRIVSVIDGRY